jgi:hypothetical protein
MMKIAKIWVILLLPLILISMTSLASNSVTDTLEEGEIQTYVLNEKFYVEVLIIEDTTPATVTFKINGEIASKLLEGEIFTLYSGATLDIIDITHNIAGEGGNGDEVTFTLTDASGFTFLKIVEADVTINNAVTLPLFHNEDFYAYAGDSLLFDVMITNNYQPSLFSIDDVTLTLFCYHPGVVATQNNINVGSLAPGDTIEVLLEAKLLDDTMLNGKACGFDVKGTDELGIVRESHLYFNINVIKKTDRLVDLSY